MNSNIFTIEHSIVHSGKKQHQFSPLLNHTLQVHHRCPYDWDHTVCPNDTFLKEKYLLKKENIGLIVPPILFAFSHLFSQLIRQSPLHQSQGLYVRPVPSVYLGQLFPRSWKYHLGAWIKHTYEPVSEHFCAPKPICAVVCALVGAPKQVFGFICTS